MRAVLIALLTLAAAKDFHAAALVGADGRSVTIAAHDDLIDSFFDWGSAYNRGFAFREVRPRGGYVLVYVLDREEFPGIPGRYYPAARAACFSWVERGGACVLVNPALERRLSVAQTLGRFTRPPTVARLFFGRRDLRRLGNIAVGVELALNRWRRSFAAGRPRGCLALRARWNGPGAARRPRSLCLGSTGVWARGRLYPLGPAVWRFARVNLGTRT